MEEVNKETGEVIPDSRLSDGWSVTSSPTIGKLIDALTKAQLKFKPVLKQNENVAFMRGGKASKYADLATYIDATQVALAENGLAVLQWPDTATDAKSMTLESILAHSSGEWMRGRLTLPATGRDGFSAQSCGSSITYARRYSYAAILGVASEDDDGNAAVGIGTPEQQKEVLDRKLKDAADAKVKKGAAIFYVWNDTDQLAYLSGDLDLMGIHKPLLLAHGKWSAKDKAMTVGADGLDALKYEFEKLGVPFKKLEPSK